MFCIKPSMFIDGPRDLSAFCREAVKQATSLAGKTHPQLKLRHQPLFRALQLEPTYVLDPPETIAQGVPEYEEELRCLHHVARGVEVRLQGGDVDGVLGPVALVQARQPTAQQVRPARTRRSLSSISTGPSSPDAAAFASVKRFAGDGMSSGDPSPDGPSKAVRRTLRQRPPDGREHPPAMSPPARVLRCDRLGGLIHEYAQVA